MSDVITITGYSEDYLPDLTISTSSGVWLDKDFSFGDLILSNSLLDRYADREIVLPLVVKNTTRAVMRNTVESLLRAVSREFFTLTWTPEGGLPIVFDCYAAQVGQAWDLILDRQAVRRINLTMLARPHGSTPGDPITLSGVNVSSLRWAALAPQNVVGSAPGIVTEVEQTVVGPSLFHSSPEGKNANAPIPMTLVDSFGFYQNNSITLLDYEGTFSVVASLSQNATVGKATLGFILYEYVGADLAGAVTGSVTVDFTSQSATSRYVAIENVSLPLARSLTGARTYRLSITSANSAGTPGGVGYPRVQDVLFLNTQGTTIRQFSTAEASGGYTPARAYILGPEPEQDSNTVLVSMGSPYRDRTTSGQLVTTISGRPLEVYNTSGGVMLLHAPRLTNPSFTAKYRPRWLSERTG